MTIDPRWSIGLSILLGALTFLVAVPDWTNSGIDPATMKRIIFWMGIALGIGNLANGVLGGIPSKDNQRGFIIKGPAPPQQAMMGPGAGIAKT